MNKLILGFLNFIIINSTVFAVQIGDIIWDKNRPGWNFSISHQGNLTADPIIKMGEKRISLLIPNGKLKSKIQKQFQLDPKKYGPKKWIEIKANQNQSNQVKIEFNFPNKFKKSQEEVSYVLTENEINLLIPYRLQIQNIAQRPKNTKKEKSVLSYDEKYLAKLLQEDNIAQKKVENSKPEQKKQIVVKKPVNQKSEKLAKLSDQEVSRSPSFQNYILRFVFALLGIIVIFYFVLNILRRGVIKKGKFSTLFSNRELIKILSTSYLAPKKAIHLIQVQDQIFLIGSSEQSVNFLSELNNPIQILKQGEKSIDGKNFDTGLDKANLDEKVEEKVKIKDLTDLENQKLKYQEQLKQKMKTLKSLQ